MLVWSCQTSKTSFLFPVLVPRIRGLEAGWVCPLVRLFQTDLDGDLAVGWICI